MTDQIDYEAVRHEEMQADFERAARRKRGNAQRCVDCKHAHWLSNRNYNTRAFNERVGFVHGIGVCVIDDDPPSVGITTGDNANTTGCDMFEAVER